MRTNDKTIWNAYMGYKISTEVAERIGFEITTIGSFREKAVRNRWRSGRKRISWLRTSYGRIATWWGASHVLNAEILPSLGKSAHLTYQRLVNMEKARKEVKMAGMALRMGEKWENCKTKGKCKNSGASVRFAEIENGGPRNAVISTDQTGAVSEENEAHFGRSGSFNIENSFGTCGAVEEITGGDAK